MAFVARCSFCHLILRDVPEARLGSSVDCPRCHSSFTLAPATDAVAVAAGATKTEAPEPSVATEGSGEPSTSTPLTALAGMQGETDTVPDPTSAAASPAAEPQPAATPAARYTNYPGLASFLLGCFAFLAGSLLHAGLATLALGFLGLLLGVMGLVLSWLVPCGRVLPVFGLAVSLPALLLPVLAPDWIELDPLGVRPRPSNKGDAAMSRDGAGGLRRATGADPLWADAGRDALYHGDAGLSITSAVVGPVDFEPQEGRRPPADRCLVLTLRLTNAGIVRNLRYTGWPGEEPTQEPPLLRDSQGKTYAVKRFAAGWAVKGRAPSATVPPGKAHNDVLVFEAPPRGAGPLRLELPAAAVGGEGLLRMEIPNKMIVFR